jgi:hypothetical protein
MSRHAMSSSPPYRRARTPEQASDRRSMASLREHCVPTGVTCLLPLGRWHAAAAHMRAGALPSATGQSLAARRPLPWRPCRGSCRHDARAMLLVKLLAYKNPSRVTPCARLRTPHPPPSPLEPPWWACFSACSPTRPSLWSPSLTSTRASPITYGLDLPPHSPGTSPPRRCRGCLAAGHHRVVPRPSHQYQSNPSESNRSPRSLVCVPWPHLAAGEHAHRRQGTVGRAEGISVN